MAGKRKPYKYMITYMATNRAGDSIKREEKFHTKKTAEARFRNLEGMNGAMPCLQAL